MLSGTHADRDNVSVSEMRLVILLLLLTILQKSSSSDDENDNEEQKSNDAEKLILSQDTYNTLTRSTNKKTVSFYNASSSMKRKMSSFETQSEESFIH